MTRGRWLEAGEGGKGREDLAASWRKSSSGFRLAGIEIARGRLGRFNADGEAASDLPPLIWSRRSPIYKRSVRLRSSITKEVVHVGDVPASWRRYPRRA